MTYRETLARIFGLARFGIRPGLERISTLLSYLGDPHNQIRVVSVAGTNGKGSTASFLSSILIESGLRVGLFTSPHLIDFTERIRINGKEIDQEDVVELAGKVQEAAPLQTTFFETVTAMAFLYFAQEKVDIAIMEVGMGGRYDATNVADPILSIITPISFDHCEYLGKTLSEIALEKTGIIRAGRPLVYSRQEPEVSALVEEAANACESPTYLEGRDFDAIPQNSSIFVYRGLKVDFKGVMPGIPGRHQAGNAACALCAAELLSGAGFSINARSLHDGVVKAFWPGRMEMFPGSPRILLDGAHNPAGSQALALSLGDIQRRRLLLVVGVMGDKDIKSLIGPLLKFVDHVYAVKPSLDRSMPAEELYAIVLESGASCSQSGDVISGIKQALRDADSEDLILVTGSLFTVGEARAWLISSPCEQIRG